MDIPQLDIIVPQYKETEAQIRKLLDSIQSQIGFDFRIIKVTIVNDASDVLLSKEFLDHYTFEINYIRREENGGPGLTRQTGIDNTNYELFMFIDADDLLFSNITLVEIYKHILSNMNRKWAVLSTQWLEENTVNGYVFVPHQSNMVWTHGKIYNREWIQEKGIRFHDKLRLFEDMYFNKQVVLSCAENEHLYTDAITYLWMSNPESLTRKGSAEKAYLWTYSDDFIYSADEVMKKLTELEVPRRHEIIINSIALYYYVLQTSSFLDDSEETKEKIQKIRKTAYDLIIKYESSFKESSIVNRAGYINAARNEAMNHFGFNVELITWNDWIKDLDRDFGKDNSAYNIAKM